MASTDFWPYSIKWWRLTIQLDVFNTVSSATASADAAATSIDCCSLVQPSFQMVLGRSKRLYRWNILQLAATAYEKSLLKRISFVAAWWYTPVDSWCPSVQVHRWQRMDLRGRPTDWVRQSWKPKQQNRDFRLASLHPHNTSASNATTYLSIAHTLTIRLVASRIDNQLTACSLAPAKSLGLTTKRANRRWHDSTELVQLIDDTRLWVKLWALTDASASSVQLFSPWLDPLT